MKYFIILFLLACHSPKKSKPVLSTGIWMTIKDTGAFGANSLDSARLMDTNLIISNWDTDYVTSGGWTEIKDTTKLSINVLPIESQNVDTILIGGHWRFMDTIIFVNGPLSRNTYTDKDDRTWIFLQPDSSEIFLPYKPIKVTGKYPSLTFSVDTAFHKPDSLLFSNPISSPEIIIGIYPKRDTIQDVTVVSYMEHGRQKMMHFSEPIFLTTTESYCKKHERIETMYYWPSGRQVNLIGYKWGSVWILPDEWENAYSH